jgi:DNA-binding response OmpR family regulator
MAVIVVADDDMDVVGFIAYSFEVAGHTVHAAWDGLSALRLARTCVPDLVVLDQAMPGLTGLQVTAALRSGADTAALPIVLVTADGTARANGLVDRLILKPMRPRELVMAVRELLPGVPGAVQAQCTTT